MESLRVPLPRLPETLSEPIAPNKHCLALMMHALLAKKPSSSGGDEQGFTMDRRKAQSDLEFFTF